MQASPAATHVLSASIVNLTKLQCGKCAKSRFRTTATEFLVLLDAVALVTAVNARAAVQDGVRNQDGRWRRLKPGICRAGVFVPKSTGRPLSAVAKLPRGTQRFRVWPRASDYLTRLKSDRAGD
jgi:hypothetical protein